MDNLIDREIEKLAEFVDLTQYLDRSKLHKLKSINLILLEESLFSVYCSQTISFMAVPIISDYKSELHGWCYTLNHDKGY